MKPLSLLILGVFLTFSHSFVFAQEDVKAKHAAYYRCTNTIQKEPHTAYQYCSDYLKKYPDDNPRLVEFVKKWITAYKLIRQFVEKTENLYIKDNAQSWAIFNPDLEKEIPRISEKWSQFKIEIERQSATGQEDIFLRKAEAVYQNPDIIYQNLFKNWRFLNLERYADGLGELTLSNGVVTTTMVLYYHTRAKKLRSDPEYKSSELKYNSSIKKYLKYERGGKTFDNVYVADMTLTWGEICGFTCGEGFTRNKIVILDEKGNVLEMFLDADVNSRSWVS